MSMFKSVPWAPATGCRLSLPLPQGQALDVHRFDFAEHNFHPSMFRRAGMACPPSVAQSVQKRQAEFFFGRLAARAALAAVRTGVPFDLRADVPFDLPIGPSRAPVWPQGLAGSISHCRGVAAAVAAPQPLHGALGLDVEHVVDAAAKAAILGSAISEAELEVLRGCAAHLPLDSLLTLCFSAKESLYKAAHPSVGRFFGFEAAQLVALDVQSAVLSLMLTEHLSASFPIGRVCRLGFIACADATVLTAFATGHAA
jgi:enterobactin synthetase component D